MRKSSYFAMSLLLTALSAQAADTMGGVSVSGSTPAGSVGVSSGISGPTPSPTGTNTTPMQNPVGSTSPDASATGRIDGSASTSGGSNAGTGVTTQGYGATPQGSTVNSQTNSRNSTVESTSRATDSSNPNALPSSGNLQGSTATGVTTTTTTTGTSGTGTVSSGTAPDNTRVNARDRGNQTLTPGDQGNNRADVSTTSAVRRALVKSNMSTTARNIKIITTNGRVTLRGPVKTEAEKMRIEALAKAAAGANAVDNQLDVKANTTY